MLRRFKACFKRHRNQPQDHQPKPVDNQVTQNLSHQLGVVGETIPDNSQAPDHWQIAYDKLNESENGPKP